MNKKVFVNGCLAALIGTGLLAGCAATALSPEAAKVMISTDKPPKNCRFVGMVEGSQGGAFKGAYTSNKNLEIGAMNDLRNQAAALGANYVRMMVNHAASTQSGSMGSDGWGNMSGGMSGGQTSSTTIGNAYKCKKLPNS